MLTVELEPDDFAKDGKFVRLSRVAKAIAKANGSQNLLDAERKIFPRIHGAVTCGLLHPVDEENALAPLSGNNCGIGIVPFAELVEWGRTIRLFDFRAATDREAAQVTIERLDGSRCTVFRSDFDEYQNDRENRRTLGRYTLEEAALAIAAGSTESASDMLKKLMRAARDESLPVYEPGRNARVEYGPGFTSRVRDDNEQARWQGLNEWLAEHEPYVEFRFPDPNAAPTATEHQKTSPPVLDVAPTASRRLPEPSEQTNRPGVTKAEILAADWLLPRGAPLLANILDERPKWVSDACNPVGRPGKGRSGSHLWNPALLAACLHTTTPQKRWRAAKHDLDRVIRESFDHYLDQWLEAKSHL